MFAVWNKPIASLIVMFMLAFSVISVTAVNPPASAQEATSEVRNMALVTVQFDDLRHNKDLFDPGTAVSSFKSFFNANSYGKLNWNVTISPSWHTLAKSFKDYNISCRFDSEGPNASTQQFIIDALRSASTGLDLTRFEYVMIVYPRYNSVEEQGCTLPGHSWKVDDREYNLTLSLVRESASYSWLNDNLWVMQHQAGHFLGLPDLYAYDDGKTPVAWDIMGWPPGAHNSTMLGAWSKIKLGWIDEKNIKTIDYGQHETVTLGALGKTSTGTVVVKVPITRDHYYLLESRARVGADAQLPADVLPGVIITEVNESLDVGKVQWLNSELRVANYFAKEVKDIAFIEGDVFLTQLIGSIRIKSKTLDSYVVEIDRSTVFPKILNGKYDYNGIKIVNPEGWKSQAIGWDVYLAKDIPHLGISRFKDSVMSIRITDPNEVLEEYRTNPLFEKVECKPFSLRFLEVNGAKGKELIVQCSPLDSGTDFKPHLAKTYSFSFEQQVQGVQGKVVERILSLTFASDSPLVYSTFLPAFEELVASLSLEHGTDIRVLDNSAARISELNQRVSVSNSTIDMRLLTNSNISGFQLDPDANRITFKASARDSSGITRIEYDSILKAPYLINVNGESDNSFLIIKDEISGMDFIQLSHQVGLNDISISGMDTVLPIVPSQQDNSVELVDNGPDEALPENERPVEIRFVRTLPDAHIHHPSMGWKWALPVMMVD
jgi:M6 family metalloprotease-like protein